MIPLVDLQTQYRSISTDINAAIERVLTNGSFIMGQEVREFEEAFAAHCGVGNAIGVASGTAAVHLALRACGIGSGDEVITPPFTFAATAEAVFHTGARPVFVDIDLDSYNLDPSRVEAAITPKTKAILPVHLYGQPLDMDALRHMAARHDLKVVEDAAQAAGAMYKDRRAGNLGDAACFSFFPAKNLGAYGDAGMVTTNDPHIAEQVRLLRDHGRHTKHEHIIVGYGERLDALQAAILAVKLRHLDDWNDRRRQVAARYRELLVGDGIELPLEMADVKHVYYLFVVRVQDRDALLARLRKAGIGAGIHYPIPLHLQPAFASLGHREGGFPCSEQAAREVISFPMYPEITNDQLDRVADVLVSGNHR